MNALATLGAGIAGSLLSAVILIALMRSRLSDRIKFIIWLLMVVMALILLVATVKPAEGQGEHKLYLPVVMNQRPALAYEGTTIDLVPPEYDVVRGYPHILVKARSLTPIMELSDVAVFTGGRWTYWHSPQVNDCDQVYLLPNDPPSLVFYQTNPDGECSTTVTFEEE